MSDKKESLQKFDDSKWSNGWMAEWEGEEEEGLRGKGREAGDPLLLLREGGERILLKFMIGR